jgi:class 3 adenylate cyclase
LVSVLFVDLVGFTSRSDRADPEDVRDTLQTYHTHVKQQIEQYGGTVEKFIGDAVMAVFGAPTAHGDDAERAVRAGLRVLEAIEDLNREQPGLDLAARGAVNTGEAVVAIGSGPPSGEALAMGDVVNTASRLQTAAPPGRLIVGDETYRATRTVIRYEPLAAVAAKGKREPVAAWLAVAPIGGPADRPRAGDAPAGVPRGHAGRQQRARARLRDPKSPPTYRYSR